MIRLPVSSHSSIKGCNRIIEFRPTKHRKVIPSLREGIEYLAISLSRRCQHDVHAYNNVLIVCMGAKFCWKCWLNTYTRCIRCGSKRQRNDYEKREFFGEILILLKMIKHNLKFMRDKMSWGIFWRTRYMHRMCVHSIFGSYGSFILTPTSWEMGWRWITYVCWIICLL